MDTNFGLFAATNLSDNVTVLTATPQPLPPNNKQVGATLLLGGGSQKELGDTSGAIRVHRSEPLPVYTFIN